VFTAAPGAAPAVREFLARQPQPVLERPFGLEDVQGALRRVGAVQAEAAPPGGADLPEHALGRVRRK
jgi:hypothetical protein